MKQTKLFLSLLMLLSFSMGNVWGETAAVGDVLWAEDFTHFGTNTPSQAKVGSGTAIFGNATITYTQSSTNTKGYKDTFAGGTAPELLLAKNNSTWTISGIPTGDATEMALAFLSNKTTFSLTTTSSDLVISGSQKSWTIKVAEGKSTPETFDLILQNTSRSSNARIDNVELKVITAGITKTAVSLTPIVNPENAGSIVLTQGEKTANNNKIDIEEGTEVTATATPNAGYTFENWSIDGATIKSQEDNTAVITMGTTNATITANFQEETACTTTLATPTGLTVGALTTTTAELSWTGVTNASKYQVTVTPAAGGTANTYTTASTTQTATGLTAETAYTWTVQALGDATYCDSEAATGTTFTTAALPKYTVTFNVGTGSGTTPAAKTATAGAGITLPEVIDLACEDWQFAGWAETAVATATTTAPATLYAASSTYKPTANTTLYAVYSKTEGDAGTVFYGWESSDVASAWTITDLVQNTTYAKTGTYSGSTNSKSTCTIQYNTAVCVSNVTFYASKTSSNTNSANWLVETSSDGKTWNTQGTYSASGVSKGEWTEYSANITTAMPLYVRIQYSGNTVVRLIDDVTITYGSSTTTYYSNPTCTPVPTLSVSGEDIADNAITFAKTEVSKTDTKSFSLSGKNMSANATLAITGDDAGMFSVSPATVAQTDGSISGNITVTYAPTAAGNHTATLTVSSTDATGISLTLNGIAYAMYTVRWSVCGEIDATLTKQAESGATLTFPTVPTKEGLIFYGWTTEENKNYYSADTPPTIVGTATTVTGDVTYYAVFAQSKDGESGYTKVAADRDDWAGEYLIVSEGSNVAFDGSLTDLDVSGNTKSVTIKDNNIASSAELDAATFTIAKTGTSYTIQSKSGYYIGNTTNNNKLETNQTTVYTNSITYSDGNVVITASGGKVLRYNAMTTTGNSRFRYYGATYEQAIQLYEKEEAFNYNTNCAAVTKEVEKIEATNPTKIDYLPGETFDKTGMRVTATMTDGTTEDVTDKISVDEATALTMDDDHVTVSYTRDGTTRTTDVAIHVVEITEVQWNVTKTEYTEGQVFDLSSVSIEATLQNQERNYSTNMTITEGFSVDKTSGLATTDKVVTLTYGTFTTQVTITVHDVQPYTVTFSVYKTGGASTYTVTETSKQAGVQVPSVSSCGDYTFAGWSTEELILEESYTPVTIADGRFYPTDNTILYAVFSTIDGGEVYNRVTDLSAIQSGDKVMLYNPKESKFIAASSDATYGCTTTTQLVTDGTSVTLVDNNTSWAVRKSEAGYQFYQGEKCLGVPSLANTNQSVNLGLDATYSTWQLTESSANTEHFNLSQPSTESGYQHRVNWFRNNWSLYHTDNVDAYQFSFQIYKQGGTKHYTTELENCEPTLEVYSVLLNAGTGTVSDDAFEVLAGNSITLPTPTLACENGWEFYGWAENEIKCEVTQAPVIEMEFASTKDVELFAIYRRAVGSGYVYKTNPSCLQRVTISPDAGTYNEAKTITMAAGDDVLYIYYTISDNGLSPMENDYSAPIKSVKEYTAPFDIKETGYIVAVAAYEDGYSDMTFTKISIEQPKAPIFDLDDSKKHFVGEKLTITVAEGATISYMIGDEILDKTTTNKYEYEFSETDAEVGSVEISAQALYKGLSSATITKTYTVLPTPHKVILYIGDKSQDLQEETLGAGVELPTVDAPCTNGDTWEFAGWADAPVNDQTAAPALHNGKFSLSEDKELWAVYKKAQNITMLVDEKTFTTIEADESKYFGVFTNCYLSDNNREGGVRVGTKNEAGSMTTEVIPANVGDVLHISFEYKPWNSDKATNIVVSEDENNTVTVTGVSTTEYTKRTATITIASDMPSITFATESGDSRAFLRNVQISVGTQEVHYNSAPVCCTRAISFDVAGGEAIEDVNVPCNMGYNLVLPAAQKSMCEFLYWTAPNSEEQIPAGAVYTMAATATEGVTLTAHFSQPTTEIEINSEIEASKVLPYNYQGNLIVTLDGKLTMDDEYTIKDFYIATTQGKSGQVVNAEKLTITGDAYMDYTLAVTGEDAAKQWHDFAVPFPVDVMNGVYGYKDGVWHKLTNEVDYAIMDYHGDIRANGQYGWDKFRGTMQPGVTYTMTVNGDIETFRFKKVSETWKQEQDPKFSYTAYSGSGETTDEGWNGCGNMKLCYTTVSGNNFSNKVQVLYTNEDKYVTKESNDIVLTVGSAFFIQTKKDGTNGFRDVSDADNNKLYAPRYQTTETELREVKVTLTNGTSTDNLYLSMSEDALREYELAHDLQKMFASSTPKVPMLWTTNYGGVKLSSEYAPMVSDEAVYALTLYAPAYGQYSLSVGTLYGDDYQVYLTQNGAVIWNLTAAEYDIMLDKGNTDTYGILIRRMPKTTTDTKGVLNEDGIQVEKMFINHQLYIRRGTEIYDGTGKVVSAKK